VINNIFNLVIFFFIKLVPKKKNLLVFGDRGGLRFADNSRHLYIYLNKNHKNFRCIWITKSKNIYKFLKKKNYEVCYAYSIKGIYYCLRAEWHLFNFVEDDINKIITKFAKSILLWHGVLPKKLNKINHNRNLVNDFIFKKITKFFVYPNKYLAKDLLNRFPKFKYKLLVSNLPRNIILERNLNFFNTNNEKLTIKNIRLSKKKIYGYFPTWREDGVEIFRDVKNLDKFEKLDKVLKKTNSMILIKKHMNSEKKDGDRRYNPKIDKIIDKIKKFDSFIFADYDVDLNSILNQCDYLITDYSGVVFDFLYINKPIILYIPDYNEFLKNNGFAINIVKKKISFNAKNINELIKLIEKKNMVNNINFKTNKLILKNYIFSSKNNGINNIIKILNN